MNDKKHTDETKKKMSEAHSGKNNHFYGKTHTDKVKIEHSKRMKGKLVGDKNPFYGKQHSKETQDAITKKNTGKPNLKNSENMKNKVLIVDSKGDRYYISKTQFYSQIGPKDTWEWVSHKSQTGKSRYIDK